MHHEAARNPALLDGAYCWSRPIASARIMEMDMTEHVTDGTTVPEMQMMTVGNMGFLVDRLNRDCAPLQFVRELTRNSLDGIARNPDGAGVIHWDVEWNLFRLTGEEAQKLCIIDTGVGMTGPEMVQFINKLSSSIHAQSDTGNFGVGAKISAAPLNPAGMMYLSWKDGIGSMIHLFKDASGNYGLKRFDGGEFWTKVSDELKPIDKDGTRIIDQHGTMVVLLGRSQDESTMDLPEGVRAPTPRKWIMRYLNGRFFDFPQAVSVKVREGHQLSVKDGHNFLRTVTGMGPWLAKYSQSSGVVDLPRTRARVHWWIIATSKEDGGEIDTNSGHWISGGHVAGLFQNELYEVAYQNAGIARLQSFGIVFGTSRVVLYVEPDPEGSRIAANTARTALIVDGESIEWSTYAAEFRSLIPQELRDYQDMIGASAVQGDYRKAISERLKSVKDLFRFGKYRPKTGGDYRIPPKDPSGRVDAPKDPLTKEDETKVPKSRTQADVYSLFAEAKGREAELVDGPEDPEVNWLSAAEVGVQDRAARYVAGSNMILINSEFRVFTDMIDRWSQRYADVPGSTAIVEEVAREWFQQQLVETVMSAAALKQVGRWSSEEIERLWDDNALTAAVLPRYHIDMSIKRALGQRLGTLRQAA